MWVPLLHERYWLIPGFAFLTSLVWLARQGRPRIAALPAMAALVLLPIGIVGDWRRHPPVQDHHFAQHTSRFEQATPGQDVSIPIPPDWEMKLRKK